MVIHFYFFFHGLKTLKIQYLTVIVKYACKVLVVH